jgi:hypothetical protein
MNTKMKAVLVGGILVVASGTAAAGSSVHFGISLGVPVYPAPVYAPAPVPVYAPAPPVAYYPAPVYYTTPVYYAPRPFYGPGVVVRYSNWGHRHHHR